MSYPEQIFATANNGDPSFGRYTNSEDNAGDGHQEYTRSDIADKARADGLKLAQKLFELDDTKECRFGCGKVEWGNEEHREGCPHHLANEIIKARRLGR